MSVCVCVSMCVCKCACASVYLCVRTRVYGRGVNDPVLNTVCVFLWGPNSQRGPRR